MYSLKQLESGVCAADGFYADGVSAGLKANGAKDMAFIYSDTLCDVAAVFTTNKMAAAPLKHFKAKGDFQTNFVIINSKNANAMTGQAGVSDIEEVLFYASKRSRQPGDELDGCHRCQTPKREDHSRSETF